MEIVIDASVAVKWFIEEPGTAAAKEHLGSEARLVAPDLVVAEVCNALWARVRRGWIEEMQARVAVDLVARCYEELVPAASLRERAFAMALELGQPVYDCFYLALAERRRTQLVTADSRLLTRLKGSPFLRLMQPLAVAP
jgi:predicted nucleic acid-binding protein